MFNCFPHYHFSNHHKHFLCPLPICFFFLVLSTLFAIFQPSVSPPSLTSSTCFVPPHPSYPYSSLYFVFLPPYFFFSSSCSLPPPSPLIAPLPFSPLLLLYLMLLLLSPFLRFVSYVSYLYMCCSSYFQSYLVVLLFFFPSVFITRSSFPTIRTSSSSYPTSSLSSSFSSSSTSLNNSLFKILILACDGYNNMVYCARTLSQ